MKKLVVVMAALLSACGGAVQNSHTESASLVVAQPRANEQVVVAAVEPANLRLIANGSEPRTVFRFQYHAGETHDLSSIISMGAAVAVDDVEAPAVPPIEGETRTSLSVRAVMPDGSAIIDISFPFAGIHNDSGSQDAAAVAARRSVQSLMQIRATMVCTTQGHVQELVVYLPRDADQQLRQLVDQVTQTVSQIATQLPSEPVGVGAEWEVIDHMHSNFGLSLNRAAHFTVTTLVQGTSFSATEAVTITGIPGDMSLPHPPGQGPQPVFHLESANGTGSATVTALFNGLVAFATSRFAVELAMTTPTQPVRHMRMRMTGDVTIHPAE